MAMSDMGAIGGWIPTATLPKTNEDGLYDRDGWLFRQEMVDCGKGATGRCRKCANGPGHGPYWYRYRWYDGKMHKRYVGKRLPQQDPGLSPNNATTVGVAAQVRELARTRA